MHILNAKPCNMPVRLSFKNHVISDGQGFLTLIDNEVNIKILCNPCNMPKYVPRLEGIMHSSLSRALCL